jgi:hopene-associated glycosyltransferase HpnB
MTGLLLAILPLAIWMYLIFGRGHFWLEKPHAAPSDQWLTTPDVAIVVPARNEADVIARSIRSLIRQDYTGPFKIFLVDDHSSDDTAKIAREVSENLYQMARLVVVPAPELPQGWGGKVHAMQAGYDAVKAQMPQAEYILFTDADIEHANDSLRELVMRAESGRLTLASFMVRLNCQTFWEKLLIPAFVFFFMMLYPFSQVRDREEKIAAAAGGAMLVKRAALDQIGGFSQMRDALIDDCTLAKHMKAQGPIWLGLSSRTVSLRHYADFDSIWNMIARTAYTQLSYSPLVLLVCVLGMVATFLLPVGAFIFGTDAVQLAGFVAWFLMAFAYMPTLRTYRQSSLLAWALPAIAFIYLMATLESARRYYQGIGGQWKGRTRPGA